VTRVLVVIKNLLDVLNQWAVLRATEQQVSDVYIRLGDALCEATVGCVRQVHVVRQFLEFVVVTCVDILYN
jgi:hypothetical protein